MRKSNEWLNFFRNENGFVLPLSAIVLLVSFLIGGLIIDGGNLYLRHGELQHLAKQSANTGLITFSLVLQEVANINKTSTCYDVEEPPEICISNNIFDFLSADEILANVSSSSVQNEVIRASKDFIRTYDPQKLVSDEDIQVIFPEDFSGDGVKIRVKVRVSAEQFFSKLLGSGEIEVEAVSLIAMSNPSYVKTTEDR